MDINNPVNQYDKELKRLRNVTAFQAHGDPDKYEIQIIISSIDRFTPDETRDIANKLIELADAVDSNDGQYDVN